MSCNSVQTKLSSYVDGEMSASEMHQVRAHIANCNACLSEIETLRSVKTTLRHLPGTPDPSEALPDRILNTISTSKRTNFRLAFALALPALAAVAMFVARSPHSTPRTAEDRDQTINRQLAKDQIFDAGSDPMSGASLVHYTNFEGR